MYCDHEMQAISKEMRKCMMCGHEIYDFKQIEKTVKLDKYAQEVQQVLLSRIIAHKEVMGEWPKLEISIDSSSILVEIK